MGDAQERLRDGMTMAFLTHEHVRRSSTAFNMRSQRRQRVQPAQAQHGAVGGHARQALLLTTVVLEVPVHRQRLRIYAGELDGVRDCAGSGGAGDPRGGDRKSLPAGPWPEKETALSLSDHIRRGGFCRPGILSEPYKMPGHRPAFFFLREFAWRRNVWYNDLL